MPQIRYWGTQLKGGTTGAVITETDPVVGAINGIVKSDGAGNISTASGEVDYLSPLSIPGTVEASKAVQVDSNKDFVGVRNATFTNVYLSGKLSIPGYYEFPEDTGAGVLADMPVSATPAAGTEMSYSFRINATDVIIVYAEADHAGGIQNPRAIITGGQINTPESITATSDGVAASLDCVGTHITTNGDSDLDNVTLADGTVGQIKHFAVKAVGNVADSVKITPATMVGGSQITFAASPLGLGCIMEYTSAGWAVIGNNGGTIS